MMIDCVESLSEVDEGRQSYFRVIHSPQQVIRKICYTRDCRPILPEPALGIC